MLLREKFGVTGTSVGLISAPVGEASNSFVAWHREIGAEYGLGVAVTRFEGNLATAVQKLQPLRTPANRYVFVPLSDQWTTFFDNGVRGSDAASAMAVLARRLQVMALRVVSVPHTMPSKVRQTTIGTYGAQILEVYDTRGEAVRSIYCANDGGRWKFGTVGEPLPFETQSDYLRTPISQRFTESDLRRYLKILAIDALDEQSFAGSDRHFVFVERTHT